MMVAQHMTAGWCFPSNWNKTGANNIQLFHKRKLTMLYVLAYFQPEYTYYVLKNEFYSECSCPFLMRIQLADAPELV